jgi:hypothetical protein
LKETTTTSPASDRKIFNFFLAVPPYVEPVGQALRRIEAMKRGEVFEDSRGLQKPLKRRGAKDTQAVIVKS